MYTERKAISISFALIMNGPISIQGIVPSKLSDGVPACCWSSVAGRGWDRRRQSGQESESERVEQESESEKVVKWSESERVGKKMRVKELDKRVRELDNYLKWKW